MTREVREQLNKLSKEVFGTSSRWQKIVNNGVAEPHERNREVTVPDTRGGFKTKTFTDKKNIIRHYTAEETVKLMMDILSTRRGNPVSPVTSSTPSVQAIDVGPEGYAVLPDGSTLSVANSDPASHSSASEPTLVNPEAYAALETSLNG